MVREAGGPWTRCEGDAVAVNAFADAGFGSDRPGEALLPWWRPLDKASMLPTSRQEARTTEWHPSGCGTKQGGCRWESDLELMDG